MPLKTGGFLRQWLISQQMLWMPAPMSAPRPHDNVVTWWLELWDSGSSHGTTPCGPWWGTEWTTHETPSWPRPIQRSSKIITVFNCSGDESRWNFVHSYSSYCNLLSYISIYYIIGQWQTHDTHDQTNMFGAACAAEIPTFGVHIQSIHRIIFDSRRRVPVNTWK